MGNPISTLQNLWSSNSGDDRTLGDERLDAQIDSLQGTSDSPSSSRGGKKAGRSPVPAGAINANRLQRAKQLQQQQQQQQQSRYALQNTNVKGATNQQFNNGRDLLAHRTPTKFSGGGSSNGAAGGASASKGANKKRKESPNKVESEVEMAETPCKSHQPQQSDASTLRNRQKSAMKKGGGGGGAAAPPPQSGTMSAGCTNPFSALSPMRMPHHPQQQGRKNGGGSNAQATAALASAASTIAVTAGGTRKQGQHQQAPKEIGENFWAGTSESSSSSAASVSSASSAFAAAAASAHVPAGGRAKPANGQQTNKSKVQAVPFMLPPTQPVPAPVPHSHYAQHSHHQPQQQFTSEQQRAIMFSNGRSMIPAPSSSFPAAAAAPAAAEFVTPTVSYAAKVSGAGHHRSASMGSVAQYQQQMQSELMGSPVLPPTAASRSAFYSLSIGAPPPPPSELMLSAAASSAVPMSDAASLSSFPPLGSVAAPAPTPVAAPVAAAASAPIAQSMEQLIPSHLQGITPEVLAAAAEIVAAQAAAKKAAAEAAEAAANMPPPPPPAAPTAPPAPVAPVAAVPMAPPMSVPTAPPMAPMAPPLAPMAPPLAPPMAPALKRSTSLPTSSASSSSAAAAASASSKATLKKFHWVALPAHAVEENTLWAELLSDEAGSGGADSLLDQNAEHIYSTFSNAPPAPKKEETEAEQDDDADMDGAEDGDDMMITPAKKARRGAGAGGSSSGVKIIPKVRLLDPKRSYNIDIALARLKSHSHEQLREALIELDESVMGDEMLRLLSNIVPTDEEVKLVSGWAVANPSKVSTLAPVESFFLVLAEIPNLAARVRMLSLCAGFDAGIATAEKWLGLVEQACKELRSSAGLKSMLRIVLQVGNTLNNGGGAAMKQAGGFKLSSLGKMRFTKSADGHTTLLHFMVGMIRKDRPDVLEWTAELPHVPQAARVEANMVAAEVKSLRETIKACETELARCSRVSTRHSTSALEGSEDSVATRSTKSLAAFLREFQSDCAPSFEALQKRLRTVHEITHAVAGWFGEPLEASSGWEAFFSLIAEFMQTFCKALAEITAKETAVAEEAKRKERALALKAKISERRASSIGLAAAAASAASTPRMNHTHMTDSSFSAGDSFDFGESPAASSQRMSMGSTAAGAADMFSPLRSTPASRRGNNNGSSNTLAPPSFLGGGLGSKLSSVREDAMLSPVRSPLTRSQASASRNALAQSSVLNSPLRSPGVKRGATALTASALADAQMLTSPTKGARNHTAAHMSSNVAMSSAGKENM